jgi:GNAT superfamily N-acetyltransferase
MPTIEPYQTRDRDIVLEVLAEAYLEDPWSRVWFDGSGRDRLPANRAWWSFMLARRCGGTRRIVYHDGSVAGFAHWQESPACQPSPDEANGLGSALLSALGGEVVSRMAPFLSLFRRQEPEDQHVHFGPFAIHPKWQGLGLGRALIEPYLEHLNSTGAVGYLETSKPENVRFYSRSGFEVVSEEEISGVRAWFMARSRTRRPTSR